jgi:hypothetical protein
MDAIPPFVFLVIALALLCMAGALGVWIFNYFTGGGATSSKRREPLVVPEIESASPSADEPAGESAQAPPPADQALLCVRRTERGELAVFVQGQQYYHLRGIKDAQVAQETLEVVKCVTAFAEGWSPAAEQARAEPSPPEPAADEESFLDQLRQTDLFSLETGTSSSGLFGRRNKRKLSSQPQSLVTPADQINDLVQQRLDEQPVKAYQDIKITTGDDGGLCFHVGGRTYAQVDQIPDPEVKTLIQDAIQVWREG